MSDTPDVTALRDALVDDIRKELVRKGLRPSMSNVLRARVDALIAAARADATRAAAAEGCVSVEALADVLWRVVFAAGYPWDKKFMEGLAKRIIERLPALAAQPPHRSMTAIAAGQESTDD